MGVIYGLKKKAINLSDLPGKPPGCKSDLIDKRILVIEPAAATAVSVVSLVSLRSRNEKGLEKSFKAASNAKRMEAQSLILFFHLTHIHVPSHLKGSLSNSVFERRTSTGSGRFASLGGGLVETVR